MKNNLPSKSLVELIYYDVLNHAFGIFLTGYAWGSSLHCRNLSISNSWNSSIFEGAFYSSGNLGILYDILTVSYFSFSWLK